MNSLRRFLLITLSSGLVLVSMVAASIGYLGARHEAEELLDAQLAQYARLLQANLGEPHDDTLRIGTPHDVGLLPDEDEIGRRGHRYENKLLFQAWQGDRLLVRSTNAPATAVYRNEAGFHDIRFMHHDWRSFVLQGPQEQWLVVAERDDIRSELALRLATEAILPGLLGLPLLLWLVWWVVGHCTQRLQAVAQELAGRNADDLSPVSNAKAPQELHGVINALNALLQRLGSVLELEKRFTADAAHELRTPITAMKLHLQNALAETLDGPARRSITHAHSAANRMSHIVQQLLALNRGLIQGPSSTLVPVALDRLVQTIADEHHGQARQAQPSLETRITATSVQGHAGMLAMLVRNLIDNALRYTPAGGHIRVCVLHGTTGSELQVSDSGPGIPAAERERVLERFYRLGGDAHPSGREGCGLGLSIAKRVADYHAATLTLDEDPELGGLRVRVVFAR